MHRTNVAGLDPVVKEAVSEGAGESSTKSLIVVQPWFDELKRLVPTN